MANVFYFLLLKALIDQFQLINEKKKAKKKSYKHSGVLMLESFRIEEEWEFSHYVQSGLQMGFTVAIDFTGSNG